MQDHLVKTASDFMEECSSLNLTNLPGLAAIGTVVVEVMFLIYNMPLRDQVFIECARFVGARFP